MALTAAAQGGAVLVDATRSTTKRFPDSLAKTVPIWAAVLNGAVARHRGRAGGPEGALAGWDSSVHLPPWIGVRPAPSRLRPFLPGPAHRTRPSP